MRRIQTVQVLISLIKKQTKYFLFSNIENWYKLLLAEDLKKLSENSENYLKIPTKIFLCLFSLGLKFERQIVKKNTVFGVFHVFPKSAIRLWKIKYLSRCPQITNLFLPLNITGVAYHCRMPFCHFPLVYKWFEILRDFTFWFQCNYACPYTNTHPYLHIL